MVKRWCLANDEEENYQSDIIYFASMQVFFEERPVLHLH